MAKRMSLEAQLLVGTAGNRAGTLMTNVRDLTGPAAPAGADISDRGSPMELIGPGMVAFSLQWESNWSDTDANVQLLYNAAVNRTAVAIRTKDFVSGKGFDGDCFITKADKKEPLKEGQKIDFEAKPTDMAGRLPQLYV
jgi:hypothetical protein